MKQTYKKTPVKKPMLSRPRRGRKLIRRARFLPAIVIAGFAAFLYLQPAVQSAKTGVLAYATNTSAAGLLVSTNSQRTANGVGTLSSNSLLTAAAQAKADDMVARDYWSHQTPDGQQPWIFVTDAGYQYTAAGENLAYGFMTSAATVTGWMNSPPHKANLLSVNFTEVGFGIANSKDYVGDGKQTVVVAMYGKPLGASTPVASSSTPTASKTKSKPAPSLSATEAENSESEPASESEEIAVAPVEHSEVLSQQPTAAPASIKRVQILGGNLDGWGITVVMMAVASSLGLWTIHKGFHFRKHILAGEKYLTHHLHLDFTVMAILFLAFVLLNTSGVIR